MNKEIVLKQTLNVHVYNCFHAMKICATRSLPIHVLTLMYRTCKPCEPIQSYFQKLTEKEQL